MVKPAAQRQAEHKARKLAKGRRLDVIISAEAADSLDALAANREQPKRQVVEDVLIQAAKGITGK